MECLQERYDGLTIAGSPLPYPTQDRLEKKPLRAVGGNLRAHESPGACGDVAAPCLQLVSACHLPKARSPSLTTYDNV